MATISPYDNIFAAAIYRGNEIYRFSGNGVADFSELINKIRDHAARIGGMVTVNVRNVTQGWASSRSVYLASV